MESILASANISGKPGTLLTVIIYNIPKDEFIIYLSKKIEKIKNIKNTF